jgi:glycerol-3-phosphate dehydrogenase (NAD(P)+)
MKRAAILGAGVMGSATAWPLTDNGYKVNLIGTHLDNEIIRSCKKDRFHPRLKRKIGVTSLGARWIGQTLAPLVKPGDRVICITKGLESDEEGNLVILPEVLRQELPPKVRERVSIAAVGGPCIAGELAGRRQSCVYFGSREIETAQQLADVFRTDYYHVWTTDDIAGLEITVALKNAYALGVGIATGLLEKSGGIDTADAHMHNLAAALFTRSCMEISCILEMSGLNTDFAFGLPGAGDLYVTCQGGRSVTVGKLLGLGKTFKEASQVLAGETLESAMIIQQMGKALPKIFEKGLLKENQIPFMNLLVDAIVHEEPIDLELDYFFNDKFI